MFASKGLPVHVPTAPARSPSAERIVTEEAAIAVSPDEDLRVELLVAEGDVVAQGAPVLRSRRHPEIVTTAPMPGRVSSIELRPGHRLSSLKLFHEGAAGRYTYQTKSAIRGEDPVALRTLLQSSGLWQVFRSRPFGRVPSPAEHPKAIFVMAADTRPLAPDPLEAVGEAGEALAGGLHALLRLTPGPVFLCLDRDADVGDAVGSPEQLKIIRIAPVHPQGLPGFQIHGHHPATIEHPVWDIHIEDACGVGALLGTGLVPETRLVSVAGSALNAARLVRCQPGADLRGLCYGYEKPGAHRILSGSALDGREARWLGTRDRQVTVLPSASRAEKSHWFLSALFQTARPMPLIATAALEQAMGGILPTLPFLRALSVGDSETFKQLGGLSFLEEDLSLVDYVTNAEPRTAGRMHEMLRRIAAEEVA